MNNINGKYNKLITIGTLPTSYTISMTYEEQLLWLLNKMEKEIIPDINQIIDFINNMDYSFDELNERIDALQLEVDYVKSEYSRITSQVDQNSQNIITLNNKIDSEILSLDNKLTALINSDYLALKNYVDYQDNVLQQEIDNINIGAISLYDPTTGTVEPLQTVINNLYGLTNKDGLTATEFDALSLTATDFDDYQITAYEFDAQGKVILV